MNTRAFENLSELRTIDFWNNYCIEAAYYGNQTKTLAPQEISKSCGYDEFDTVEVACERFEDMPHSEFCVMKQRTVINATNFIIAELKDEDIEGVDFEGNTNIEYLPYKIYKQFPSLVEYRAQFCSIKQITRENFEKLNRLKYLVLGYNQIEKISSDTFRDLESLLHFTLSEYLIFLQSLDALTNQ